jgi:uncharacterized protein YcbX
MPILARLSVTPVKGTLVRHPDEVHLTEAGIPGNRLFYLVDERGELFSGPDHGPLVRIRASYDASLERLALHMPDGTDIEAPADDLGEAAVTNFYGRPVAERAAHELRGPFGDALSAFCAKPLRLLRCDHDGAGADVEPLTLVSFGSVAELARRGGHDGPLDPRRFRMNLELEGCEPYEEDTWDGRRVRVGEATIEIAGQVPRCVFTTKHPETGEKDWNTLAQIARQRPRIGDAVTPVPEIG